MFYYIRTARTISAHTRMQFSRDIFLSMQEITSTLPFAAKYCVVALDAFVRERH